MSPFVFGAILSHPNINSFNLGILIVSIMNLVINSPELAEKQWNNFFVSPKIHLNHHQGKNSKSIYSAPTFNLEYSYQSMLKLFISFFIL